MSLAKIHIGKKQLGLTEVDYRLLLERITGLRSAAGMSENQRIAVLAEMQRLGFKAAPSATKKSPHAHVRKVFALWGDAGRKGLLENNSRHALIAFVKRQTGVADPNWLTPDAANKVTEGLKAMIARALSAQKGSSRG
jgi:phage gp16-like protein